MRKSVEYQLRTGSVVMLPAYLHVEAIIKQRGGRNIEIIQIDARITEVTETYQKGEETIEATFGDSLPTLVDQIRKVR